MRRDSLCFGVVRWGSTSMARTLQRCCMCPTLTSSTGTRMTGQGRSSQTFTKLSSLQVAAFVPVQYGPSFIDVACIACLLVSPVEVVNINMPNIKQFAAVFVHCLIHRLKMLHRHRTTIAYLPHHPHQQDFFRTTSSSPAASLATTVPATTSNSSELHAT